ncbi:MAG: WYL domain-containing protein [Elusimicrobiota bacterium]|nr:WYL domain-containing protein [Elusimicrobiota bacterium]
MITPKVKNPATKMPCHNELYDAILKHHKINLTYTKISGPATVKALPFSMILCDGLWYLGYVLDDKGQNLRTVRSSHIVKVEPLPEETFERPEWARETMKGAKNIWFSQAKTKFLLKANNSVKDYFEMSEFFPQQKIKDEGADTFTIEALYSHFNEVVPTILRFLPSIQVIEPAELKDEVARRIKEYKA